MDYAAILSAGGYFEAPANAAYQVGVGDFTIEAWIRTATAASSGTIVGRQGKKSMRQGGFRLYVKPDGSVTFHTNDGVNLYEVSTPVSTVNDGYWHHLAAVRQGEAMKVHLDGRAMPGTGGGRGRSPLNVNSDQRLTIGTSDQGEEPYQLFTGSVGSVMFWQAARDPGQIAADLGAPLRGDEERLAGYWNFDRQDGTDGSRAGNGLQAVGTIGYATPGPPLGRVITEAPAFTSITYDQDVLHAEWPPVAQDPVTGYVVEILAASGLRVANGQVADGRRTGTVTTDLQGRLPLDTALTVRARAIGDAVSGPWGPSRPVVTAVPSGVLVTTDGTVMTARWQAVPSAAGSTESTGNTGSSEAAGAVAINGYTAQLATDGVWGEPAGGTATRADFPGTPAPGTIYRVRVRARTDASSGPWSPAAPGPYLRNQVVERDGLGRVRRVADEKSATSYSQDALGNITSINTVAR
ncbi:LamG domain-containing protein [Nonomuraea insulae]|uniref:LamG domain-containing protein n=1 Tax=Nonomuraea insulae TaxID=1616787 RepID=A0ABW1CTU0_9ACTN